MKDLILIGTYCPDKERVDILNNLVDSLQSVKESFDILISTHSIIPEYISDKIDYLFYDKNNELIYDLNFINQPWFSPFDGATIYSTYTTGYSTYLAAYRLFVGGLGLAKAMGYSKVHYVEYDTLFSDFDELYENSELLNEYGSIVYKKEYKNFENNLPCLNGSFISINLSKLDKTFLEYDKNKLLSLIENSNWRTNEKVTEDILTKNNNQIVKDFNILKKKGIKIGLSAFTKKDELDYWTVPYYNSNNNTIDFVCWNNKSDKPINVNVIVNNTTFLTFENINKFGWTIKEIGNLDEINSILVLLNNKIKLLIDFNIIDKKDFTKNNYIEYN